MNISVGDVVLFNDMDDATPFEVVKVDGLYIKIREYQTNYRENWVDKSTVIKNLGKNPKKVWVSA